MSNTMHFLIESAMALVVVACIAVGAAWGGDNLQKAPFGKMPDGQEIDRYTLTNSSGMQVSIINYGGIVVSLKFPIAKAN